MLAKDLKFVSSNNLFHFILPKKKKKRKKEKKKKTKDGRNQSCLSDMWIVEKKSGANFVIVISSGYIVT